MMLRPVVREIPSQGHKHRVTGDSFLDGLSPSEIHAALRCEKVRPPAVVAPDVWIGLDDGLML